MRRSRKLAWVLHDTGMAGCLEASPAASAQGAEWARLAHRLDWKPLAGASRQDLYRRMARHQLWALGVGESEIRRRIAALDARGWRWDGAPS